MTRGGRLKDRLVSAQLHVWQWSGIAAAMWVASVADLSSGAFSPIDWLGRSLKTVEKELAIILPSDKLEHNHSE